MAGVVSSLYLSSPLPLTLCYNNNNEFLQSSVYNPISSHQSIPLDKNHPVTELVTKLLSCSIIMNFFNPSNPVGNLLTRETIYDLMDFATEKNIHIIANEALAATGDKSQEFVSMAEIFDSEEYDSNRVHMVYELSKDLSLPGLRVGVVYSFNQSVLDVSKGIDCMKSSRGCYCWADMSGFIRPYSEKGELELWEKLLNVTRINATPGSSCHCIEPGWFRFCFTSLNENEIPLVMKRIGTVL